jgi:hypothetical protein
VRIQSQRLNVSPSSTGWVVLFGIALLLTVSGSSNCAVKPRVLNDYGIPRCPADAADDLLSVNALQCWFDAPRGRWRTISCESHYAVLVVHVEARNGRDGDDIARRFVTLGNKTFSEILVYVQPESATGPFRMRRVRWTRDSGFEALEFTTPPDG